MFTTEMIIQQNRLAAHRTNHILHLILSLLSVGWWIPVWMLVALSNGIERSRARNQLRKLQ